MRAIQMCKWHPAARDHRAYTDLSADRIQTGNMHRLQPRRVHFDSLLMMVLQPPSRQCMEEPFLRTPRENSRRGLHTAVSRCLRNGQHRSNVGLIIKMTRTLRDIRTGNFTMSNDNADCPSSYTIFLLWIGYSCTRCDNCSCIAIFTSLSILHSSAASRVPFWACAPAIGAISVEDSKMYTIIQSAYIPSSHIRRSRAWLLLYKPVIERHTSSRQAQTPTLCQKRLLNCTRFPE